MVTLEQIAQEAGVSRNTVANVLNGRNKENWGSTARRAEEIRAIAKRLGYQPHAAAKATATGRFDCVALLLSTRPHVSTLPQRVLEGIHDALAERDMHLSLFRLPDEQITDPQKLPKILRQSMADGLIVDYTHRIPGPLVELIKKNHLQAVWFNTLRATDCVRPDDCAAARAAAQHLIERGHRRITYVDFQPADSTAEMHYSVEHRRQGYREAMHEAGLTPDLTTGDTRALTDEERAEHLEQRLKVRNRPTAVICYSDSDAAKALFAACRLGLRIPEDLSLLTFSRQGSWPHGQQMTRFASPEPQMGRALVEMLLQKIENPQKKPRARVLAYQLIEGQSVAAPR